MLKQWKSDEDSTKDRPGQVEGVLIDLIRYHKYRAYVLQSTIEVGEIGISLVCLLDL